MTTIAASEITALLGRGTQFEGTLLFDGRLRIDGAFRGKIVSNDTLIIGDGAQVDAQIDVANVIIRGGSVRGAIRARNSIELYVPAHVTASLHAPSVFIDKGVHFEGTCKMAELTDPPPPASPPAHFSSVGSVVSNASVTSDQPLSPKPHSDSHNELPAFDILDEPTPPHNVPVT